MLFFKLIRHQLNTKSVMYLFTVLILCLLLTYIVFNKAKAENDKNAKVYFDFRVREAISLIKNRMKAYEQVLIGASGLFISTDSVQRNEFKEYVDKLNLSESYPGIQGVGFSIIVPSYKKKQHVEYIKKEGFPNYDIWPDGHRDFYTSIIYLEPFSDRNLRAFGYDMFSEPVRHKAMQNSMNTGNPYLSGKIKLVQETGEKNQAGFLMYLPVYRSGTINKSVIERQKNIIGWVYAPFRVDDLMDGLFGEYAKDLDISIFDGKGTNDKALMFDSNNLNISSNESGRVIEVEIANHPWSIQIKPLPVMNSRINSNNLNLILVIGGVVSFLLTWLVWFLASGRERALSIAKSMNKDLIIQKERLSNIIQGTRAGTWEWNIQTGETHFNENWANIIGYELSELEPISIETWLKYVHPDDVKVSEELLNQHFSGKLDYYECEARMQHKDGGWVWVLDRGKVTHWSADGKPLIMAGTHQDINNNKMYEIELTKKAHFDYLTGLSSRSHFTEQANKELNRAVRYKTPLSLLLLDIDFFKRINDTYGHQVGDSSLKELGKMCQNTIREIDLAGRIGGEEFAILLPATDSEEALATAERLRKNVANLKLTTSDGLPIDFTISIGISTFYNGNMSIDSLLNQADVALYEAKLTGRNKVCLYKDWS